jgi:hypothetical protein
MALTITLSGDWQGNVGAQRHVRGTIAFDSSYPTGGESLTAANIGLRVVDFIEVTARSGYVFEYDYTNSSLLVYRTATVTPAGTLSTPSFAIASSASASATYKLTVSADSTVAVIAGDSLTAARTLSGTYSPVGVPTFTGNATTAAALAEVGNTTDLSALTGVRFWAVGV